MTRRTLFITAGALVALAVVGWSLTRPAPSGVAAASAPPSAAAVAAAEDRDGMIALFERRVRADPYSAGDRALLAGLLMQRSREGGGFADVLRAEEEARESLRLRPGRNERAQVTLAAALLEQHRFRDALEVAQSLIDEAPDAPVYRSLLAEIQLEMGNYAEAGKAFASLQGSREDPSVALRLARWAEISGRTDDARQLLYAVRDQAAPRTDVSAEQQAWHNLRLGDLELRTGRLDEAEDAFRAGIEVNPGDPRLLLAIARLEAARERWPRALAYADEAAAALPDGATLAVTSELYEAAGDSATAAEYARAAEVSILGHPGGIHRGEALFLLDRGVRIPEVLAEATESLRDRRDIYGYDLLGWALHESGRHAEARAAITSALSRGTQDPMLFYHAGMIERAAGNPEAANGHLRRALELNPRFHPLHAPAAREALSCMGRFRLPWRSCGDD